MLVKQTLAILSFTPARIPLGRGLFAIVDPEDLPWLTKYRWFTRKSHSRYYAKRKWRINSKEYIMCMHRQIMNCPRDMHVHHVNHNTLDNRKSNMNIIDPRLHAALHRSLIF